MLGLFCFRDRFRGLCLSLLLQFLSLLLQIRELIDQTPVGRLHQRTFVSAPQ